MSCEIKDLDCYSYSKGGMEYIVIGCDDDTYWKRYQVSRNVFREEVRYSLEKCSPVKYSAKLFKEKKICRTISFYNKTNIEVITVQLSTTETKTFIGFGFTFVEIDTTDEFETAINRSPEENQTKIMELKESFLGEMLLHGLHKNLNV